MSETIRVHMCLSVSDPACILFGICTMITQRSFRVSSLHCAQIAIFINTPHILAQCGSQCRRLLLLTFRVEHQFLHTHTHTRSKSTLWTSIHTHTLCLPDPPLIIHAGRRIAIAAIYLTCGDRRLRAKPHQARSPIIFKGLSCNCMCVCVCMFLGCAS